MKKTAFLCSVVCMAAVSVGAQNLLSNGDFNAGATGWSTWSYGTGWANFEPANKLVSGNANYWAAGVGIYDGTTQLTVGGMASSGGGAYQIVPITSGMTYQLSAAGGVENWWLPTSEIRLFFLDASNTQLDLITISTTAGLHNPDLYDAGVPYQAWSLSGTAPAGATQAKVEFSANGGGSVWFDNASLTVVPEPGVAGLFALGSACLLALRVHNRKS